MSTQRRDVRRLLALLASFIACPAIAHPHVWVTAKAALIYGADGRLTAVRHLWTFDEGYSAFATQGLDLDGDGRLSATELAPLARTSVESLAEFDYFTQVRAGSVRQEFGPPGAPLMSLEGGRLTLRFDLPLKTAAANRLILLDVYDPSSFAEFRAADGDDALRLEGAPAGCATTVRRPKPAEAADTKNLSEPFFQSLQGASTLTAQLANRVMVACP